MEENNNTPNAGGGHVIAPGQFVRYTYRVTDADDGRVLFEAPDNAPDCMVYGVNTEVIPGLVETLKGLKAGDRFSITLPPAAAFGERSDENVVTVPKEAFMRDGEMAEEVQVGAMLPMLTENGFTVTGVVKAINEHDVEMDFNHPFAGLTVSFEGEVREVRPATPEELNPRQGCCGCGEHGCGDHGCGDQHDGECGHGCNCH